MVKRCCSKYFPKQFQWSITINEDGFPIYKRKDISENVVEKNGIELDNRFVVPHNI